jgi:hypothetical protein
MDASLQIEPEIDFQSAEFLKSPWKKLDRLRIRDHTTKKSQKEYGNKLIPSFRPNVHKCQYTAKI